MNYYIGADLGTSSLKLLLTDSSGKTLRSVSRGYELSFPAPGWSEQAPADWWDAFVCGIAELIKDIPKEDLRGIGVAGQMHGLVILDEKDEVIRPAILWNDGRCDKETDYLNFSVGKEKLVEYTGNIAFAGFTAPKLLWLKKHERESFDKISKIMLPKDYLNYRLTGVHSTDHSDASGTLMFDVKNKCWSKEMLEICGVEEKMMPKSYESYSLVGTVLPEVAKKLGLPEGLKVAAGAADNAGAAIGTATVGNGKCNISLGTSGTVFITSDKFSEVGCANALHSFCHADGSFHLMACILSAASCNKWFCGDVLSSKDYEGEQSLIDTESLGENEVFFLPYLMGERSPINDTDATGAFIGLRPNTKRSDMILAVLEGVCFAIRDNMEIAKELGIKVGSSTVCGGGARSRLWMKILANVLDTELVIPSVEEGPGYGAARLAAVASGEFAKIGDCVSVDVKEVIRPEAKLVSAYDRQYAKFRKIYPNMKKLFKDIKEL